MAGKSWWVQGRFATGGLRQLASFRLPKTPSFDEIRAIAGKRFIEDDEYRDFSALTSQTMCCGFRGTKRERSCELRSRASWPL